VSQKKPANKGQKPSPAKLLKWYDRFRRVLPWRALPDETPDPYHVWLSEIMLQQTTVAAVGPYFRRFIERWPTLQALAAAELDEVFRMWAGLGYYRRARGLHACAQLLVAEQGGTFPRSEEELRKLPGLGPYTAAAVMAIAFDRRANVVDGNVERVMARLYAVQTPLPKAKADLRTLAEQLLPKARFGDYAQALMDLGATICTPRSPKCEACPWASACLARAQNCQQELPRREAKKAKPVRRAMAFVAFNERGAVFLRQRPETGLLASMIEVPSTPWEEKPLPPWPKARTKAPFSGRWRLLSGLVHHTFTHFDLELSVAIASLSKPALRAGQPKGKWVPVSKLKDQALPSVMRKILRHAQKQRQEGD